MRQGHKGTPVLNSNQQAQVLGLHASWWRTGLHRGWGLAALQIQTSHFRVFLEAQLLLLQRGNNPTLQV